MRAREMALFSHSLHFIIYILRQARNKKNQRNEIVKDNANILLTTTAEATKTKRVEQEQRQKLRQKPQRTKVGNAYCVAALP